MLTVCACGHDVLVPSCGPWGPFLRLRLSRLFVRLFGDVPLSSAAPLVAGLSNGVKKVCVLKGLSEGKQTRRNSPVFNLDWRAR